MIGLVFSENWQTQQNKYILLECPVCFSIKILQNLLGIEKLIKCRNNRTSLWKIEVGL